MQKLNEVSADNVAKMVGCLDEVYGNAKWALRYGATKKLLLLVIEWAFAMHQDCLLKDGWLIQKERAREREEKREELKLEKAVNHVNECLFTEGPEEVVVDDET